ncbi:hypothetical protein HK105_208943 [Polyrhizophydium stewartii]|uniref:Uncharacterized protein n=1 Tax=Polyrhizophydium stewartii TaxID=2732419 RepID=A0ABR4MWG5_9FUNG
MLPQRALRALACVSRSLALVATPLLWRRPLVVSARAALALYRSVACYVSSVPALPRFAASPTSARLGSVDSGGPTAGPTAEPPPSRQSVAFINAVSFHGPFSDRGQALLRLVRRIDRVYPHFNTFLRMLLDQCTNLERIPSHMWSRPWPNLLEQIATRCASLTVFEVTQDNQEVLGSLATTLARIHREWPGGIPLPAATPAAAIMQHPQIQSALNSLLPSDRRIASIFTYIGALAHLEIHDEAITAATSIVLALAASFSPKLRSITIANQFKSVIKFENIEPVFRALPDLECVCLSLVDVAEQFPSPVPRPENGGVGGGTVHAMVSPTSKSAASHALPVTPTSAAPAPLPNLPSPSRSRPAHPDSLSAFSTTPGMPILARLHTLVLSTCMFSKLSSLVALVTRCPTLARLFLVRCRVAKVLSHNQAQLQDHTAHSLTQIIESAGPWLSTLCIAQSHLNVAETDQNGEVNPRSPLSSEYLRLVPTALDALAARSRRLDHLVLTGIRDLDVDACVCITTAIPRLRTLAVSLDHPPSDADIARIVAPLSMLRNLRLTVSGSVGTLSLSSGIARGASDESLNLLASRFSASLELVSLVGDEFSWDGGLANLVASCDLLAAVELLNLPRPNQLKPEPLFAAELAEAGVRTSFDLLESLME